MSDVRPPRQSWRIATLVLAAIVTLAVWAAVVGVATIGGWWRPLLAPRGDARAFVTAASRTLDQETKGNAVFVLLKNGKVFGEHFVSRGRPVDRDTLFQVASVSKWVTAWGVMQLVQHELIELDTPVSRYVSRWKLPPSEFDNDAVTIRRLLSHTAGLTDGLGYKGFAPGARVQSIEESLTRASDPMDGASGVVRVGTAPGSTWRYSGGGYALLQLVIEEMLGEGFDAYMQNDVFQPLGMTRSTFAPSDNTPNVAQSFNADGSEVPHYRFAAQAAASLYTSAADLVRFVQAHLPERSTGHPKRGMLRAETLAVMRQPQGFRFGRPLWGLGVALYAANGADGFIIGHDGNNAPAINTTVRFDPATGDGIIVLESGSPLLASKLGGEWVFWRTGNVDFVTIFLEGETTLAIFAVGAVVILLGAGLLGRRGVRRG